MNKTLEYILKKYNIHNESTSPIILPHTREDLAKLLNELEFKTGAEIGVSSGNFSKINTYRNRTRISRCSARK